MRMNQTTRLTSFMDTIYIFVPTGAGLVSGILASQASWKYSAVCGSTIVAYSAFTLGVTQWRTKFRKQMIALENEASAKVWP